MDQDQAVIQAQGLVKSYGKTKALAGVSFSVAKGEIFGYLGPNGAGKTTTINTLCGLLAPDAGRAVICGYDVGLNPVEIKQRIGVVPEESNLYPELTCKRNLEYLGELYGLSRMERRAKTAELLQTFDLAEKASHPYKTLSKGMKRRLTIAAALIHSPQVVFLDEPTAGLDVPSARALRSLILDIHRAGTTVFLTTHNLSEAEELAQRVAILLKGRIAVSGTVAEIKQQANQTKNMTVTFSSQPVIPALLAACPAIKKAAPKNDHLHLEILNVHDALEQLTLFAKSQGLGLLEISTLTPSLEDAFMTLVSSGQKAGIG